MNCVIRDLKIIGNPVDLLSSCFDHSALCENETHAQHVGMLD
jgi:hypothetical protein